MTLIIIVLGIQSLYSICRSQYPKVDLGKMIIKAKYPGASAEDVEKNLTNRIEDQLKLLSGIKSITSVSLENASFISVHIKDDENDLEAVKSDIKEAVGRVSGLPLEVTESPTITDVKSSIFPIIEIGITGDIPYKELRELARRFEKLLREVPGVASINKFGYRAREIKIDVNPDLLKKYQIPLGVISKAISARNIHATGGTLESYTNKKNIVTLSQFQDPLEVGDVIVKTSYEGPVVKVKDLAIIYDDFEKETIFTRINGLRSISFVVNKGENSDIVRTVNAIKKLAEAESKHLPEGVRFLYNNDVSKYVKNQFNIVIWNGSVGLLLVIIILTLFLNLRVAFWIAAGIPLTILGVIFLLPIFGVGLDSITLAAMILVIGIIVDDAIIISESIYSRFEKGDTPLKAAVGGINDVFLPVLTTILTTFMAFLPMFFLKGILGKFIYVIPLTVTLALFISLLEAMIILPAHLIPGLTKDNKSRGAKWFDKLKVKFHELSLKLLNRRYYCLGAVILIFLGTLFFASKKMDFILFPSKGAEEFLIFTELPVGTSLAGTSNEIKVIEDLLNDLPKDEIASYAVRIGGIGNVLTAEKESIAVFAVNLTPFANRNRTADQIIKNLKTKTDQLKQFLNIRYDVITRGPPVGKPIEVYVTGSDNVLRKKLASDLLSFLERQAGVKVAP